MAGSRRSARRAAGRVGLVMACAVGCADADPAQVAPVTEPAPELAPLDPLAPIPAPALRPAERPLASWLAGCAVSDGAFARHKLYTWTTAEQIEALRRDHLLLTRGRRDGEMSRFDTEITDDDHPIARHLRRRDRAARRYAWVSPWPTRMGWPERDHGEQLIEVRLRESAWTARFDPSRDGEGRWRVVDAEGRAVPDDEIAPNLARIAAVLHVARGEHAFREIVLVDERQIASWSVATPSIRARLAEDARRLRALASAWESREPDVPAELAAWLREGWASAPDDASLLDRYRRCLALGSALYAPTAAHVLAIAEALEATPLGEPIEHEVRVDRTFGVVLGSHRVCDPTAGCWDTRGRWTYSPWR